MDVAAGHRARGDADVVLAKRVRPPARRERDLHGRPLAPGPLGQQPVHMVPARLFERRTADRTRGRVECRSPGRCVCRVRERSVGE